MHDIYIRIMENIGTGVSGNPIIRPRTGRVVEIASDGIITAESAHGNNFQVDPSESDIEEASASQIASFKRAYSQYAKESSKFQPEENKKVSGAGFDETDDSTNEYKHRLAKIKQKSPNAYEPWTVDQDNQLRTMIMKQMKIARIAEVLGRQESAIGSRIRKLGDEISTEDLSWMETQDASGAGFVEANDSTEEPSKEPFSHSRLETFEQCRKKYWYSYVEKQPDLYDGIEAFAGTIAHKTLEWLYERKGAGVTPDELSNKYNDLWEQQEKTSNKEIRTVKKGTPPDHHRQQMEKAVLNYYSRKFLKDRSQTLMLEDRLTMDLDDEKYRGDIDRVAQSGPKITIIDYKSNQGYEKIDQLRSYGTLYMENHEEVQRVDMVFEFLVNGTNTRETMTRRDTSQVKQKLKERISKTRGISNFPAEPGILCLWCSYNTMCNEFQSSKYNQIKLYFKG